MPCLSVCLIAVAHDKVTDIPGAAATDYTTQGFQRSHIPCTDKQRLLYYDLGVPERGVFEAVGDLQRLGPLE